MLAAPAAAPSIAYMFLLIVMGIIWLRKAEGGLTKYFLARLAAKIGRAASRKSRVHSFRQVLRMTLEGVHEPVLALPEGT
jgi:hypothetical protein